MDNTKERPLTFEELKAYLQECIDNYDTEMAHGDADDALCTIALNTEFTKEQREELVELYADVKKWFA
jgi:hypothetical protein